MISTPFSHRKNELLSLTHTRNNSVFSSRTMAHGWYLASIWISVFQLFVGISNTLQQVLLASVAFMSGMSYGMSSGHSAVLLPQLQSENSTLPIDTETGSWIGKTQQQLLINKCDLVWLAWWPWILEPSGVWRLPEYTAACHRSFSLLIIQCIKFRRNNSDVSLQDRRYTNKWKGYRILASNRKVNTFLKT